MYDFLNQNQMYIVLCITLIVWIGIICLLFRMEKKLTKIEKQLEKDNQ